ncbi:MAG: hypothetical protein ACKPKO_52045, partial [Candidatus Fonsibacter sp.]
SMGCAHDFYKNTTSRNKSTCGPFIDSRLARLLVFIYLLKCKTTYIIRVSSGTRVAAIGVHNSIPTSTHVIRSVSLAMTSVTQTIRVSLSLLLSVQVVSLVVLV